MSIRSELARLRQQADQVRTDSYVKAISDLMDELSAEAAGGGETRPQLSLQDAFDEALSPTNRNNEQ